jgi:hypothetical protein
MSEEDPARLLSTHPEFQWLEGMRDRRGRRVVDLDLWDGGVPDLGDPATAGALLKLIDDRGALTDVIREAEGWIVAVDLPGVGLQGWAGGSLGEAAAWALLKTYEALATGAGPTAAG